MLSWDIPGQSVAFLDIHVPIVCSRVKVTPVLEYHLAVDEREWGDGFLTGSRGSVVSALDFQSLILGSIPGGNRSFLLSFHPLSLSH